VHRDHELLRVAMRVPAAFGQYVMHEVHAPDLERHELAAFDRRQHAPAVGVRRNLDPSHRAEVTRGRARDV
jgi:hypothetical protein